MLVDCLVPNLTPLRSKGGRCSSVGTRRDECGTAVNDSLLEGKLVIEKVDQIPASHPHAMPMFLLVFLAVGGLHMPYNI